MWTRSRRPRARAAVGAAARSRSRRAAPVRARPTLCRPSPGSGASAAPTTPASAGRGDGPGRLRDPATPAAAATTATLAEAAISRRRLQSLLCVPPPPVRPAREQVGPAGRRGSLSDRASTDASTGPGAATGTSARIRISRSISFISASPREAGRWLAGCDAAAARRGPTSTLSTFPLSARPQPLPAPGSAGTDRAKRRPSRHGGLFIGQPAPGHQQQRVPLRGRAARPGPRPGCGVRAHGRIDLIGEGLGNGSVRSAPAAGAAGPRCAGAGASCRCDPV